jgi:hypothetical protein
MLKRSPGELYRYPSYGYRTGIRVIIDRPWGDPCGGLFMATTYHHLRWHDHSIKNYAREISWIYEWWHWKTGLLLACKGAPPLVRTALNGWYHLVKKLRIITALIIGCEDRL